MSNNNPVEPEQKESIDVFQDLPLKEENDVQSMETKLCNALYRNKMVSTILVLQSILKLKYKIMPFFKLKIAYKRIIV